MMYASFLFLLAVFACSETVQSNIKSKYTPCRKTYVESDHGHVVYLLEDKNVLFTAGMAIDADGSPRAYHPQNIGLDTIYHATHHGKIVGFVTLNGEPVIQGQNDPAPGYYVSQTALFDASKSITDPYRYVNSETIPYIVLPAHILNETDISLGDLALVYNETNNKTSYAILADIGPENKIGEGSIKLANLLGIPSSPKTGGVAERVSYLIFPGSGDKKPLQLAEIDQRGEKLFQKYGGIKRLKECL